MSRVVFSCAEFSFDAAQRELRSEFGRDVPVTRLGPDLGAVDDVSVERVAEACRTRPLAFIRHLTVGSGWLPLSGATDLDATDLDAVAGAAAAVVRAEPRCRELSVQAWVSGPGDPVPFTTGALAQRVTGLLRADGITVAPGGQPYVLSCCVTRTGIVLGLNRAELSLADWPGGRVRLSKRRGQVSRAEFKLEELLTLVDVPLRPGRDRALDLGAAPGGWTRVLAERGLDVWAVDPGDMDPRVTARPNVHHVRTTAGEFLRSTGLRFHVAVNDMRMEPDLSCRVMLDVARGLTASAPIVVTLKTGSNRAVDTVRRCLRLLEREYDVAFARQLHHNRQEVTVLAHRR